MSPMSLWASLCILFVCFIVIDVLRVLFDIKEAWSNMTNEALLAYVCGTVVLAVSLVSGLLWLCGVKHEPVHHNIAPSISVFASSISSFTSSVSLHDTSEIFVDAPESTIPAQPEISQAHSENTNKHPSRTTFKPQPALIANARPICQVWQRPLTTCQPIKLSRSQLRPSSNKNLRLMSRTQNIGQFPRWGFDQRRWKARKPTPPAAAPESPKLFVVDTEGSAVPDNIKKLIPLGVKKAAPQVKAKGPYPLIHLPFDPSYAVDTALFKGEKFNPHLWLSGQEVPGYGGTWNQIGEGFVGCGPQWDRPIEMRPPHAPIYRPSIFNFEVVPRPVAPRRHHLSALGDSCRARYLGK